MRILQISTPFLPVTSTLQYGGIERVVYYLDRELTKRGHKSYVAATDTSSTTGKLLNTIHGSIGVDFVLNKNSKKHNPGLNLRLEHISNALNYIENPEVNPHIVHVHDDNMLPFLNSIKRPSLLTLHSDYEGGFWNLKYHPAMKKEKFELVAISESQKKIYEEAGFKINYMVYNGTDPEIYSLPDQPKMDYLLSLGGIMPVKGQHNAVEVAKKTGTNLIIAGKISHREYYDERIKPNITDHIVRKKDKIKEYKKIVSKKEGLRIIHAGPMNDKQKNPIYKYAKAFLMPVEWEEPFGLVMIEAMASGTPVIAFNRGSIPEIVIPGKTGFVVETIDEMVDAVKECDKIKPEDCRNHVLENFSIGKMVSDYETIYQELLIKN